MHHDTHSSELEQRIKDSIRNIPDFPKPGIIFKDITPVLLNPALCHAMLEEMESRFHDIKIDAVAAIEARGFLFGFLLAQHLQVPFIPLRKAGKLPHKTVAFQYSLEYGMATVEMHEDAVKPGMNVLIHDDLLATGGTAVAAASLVRQQGAHICGFSFIIELDFLSGAAPLKKFSPLVDALVHF